MPKYKIGSMATLVYDDEPFNLSSSEYAQYEDKLLELDQYNPEDVDAKTEWITYRFLEDLGYPVLTPKAPEPIPNMNIFEFGTAEGAGVEMQDQKYKESQRFDVLRDSEDFE